jgi:hypothetical protein
MNTLAKDQFTRISGVFNHFPTKKNAAALRGVVQ